MNIFEFAMKMEKDGEAYYRDLANNTDDKGLKTILTMMADEEVKHYNIFKTLGDGKVDMAESGLMGTVKNVFEELSGRTTQELTGFGEDAVEAYRKAQELEKKSEDLYRQKAVEIGDPDQKLILNRIADEEHKHWLILDNMIAMIERPDRWIEDAEWRHTEEY